MNWRFSSLLLSTLSVNAILGFSSTSGAPVNQPEGEHGSLPTADDGRPLNFNFEKGTLVDWTTNGPAFEKQPIKGRITRQGNVVHKLKSQHVGDYWIGGYEKSGDDPTGTLTSVPFTVTKPYASFLVGGGASEKTRVELIDAETGKPFFTASGLDVENLAPVVVDLSSRKDKKIFIRLVDENSGGWGHINFDEFLVYDAQPKFPSANPDNPAPEVTLLYPNSGLDPEAAAKAMETAEGFKVQLAAGEPDVRQPIAMAIDHRGRLWIAEGFQYPRRAPEGKGKDVILIFEDTDSDGKLDKRTVFAENLNLVSGLEVGFGGVWVGAAPYLMFIPDRNGDDKPDGEPEILLDGWAHQDTHETLNAFIWGPDGWLYGCHGVFTYSNVGKPGTPKDQRTPLNAAIWRYHPTQHKIEVFAHGTSNPWGVDFNDYGDTFCTACVIPHLFHIIHNARYDRQSNSHFNRYTYDDIKTIADHLHYAGNQWNAANQRQSDNLGGGHAHAGAMIYLGGSWPEKYRNQIFMSNIHGNRVNEDLLAPEGSGYVGHHGPDFILTRDQWAQILNLRYGPDGQAWMIDWYDKNECHHNDVNGHDRSNGRIYRISYQDAKPVKFDVTKLTDAELVELQTNKNDWYVRHARRCLQERAAAGKLAPTAREALQKLATTHADDTRRLRGLWALHVTGGVPTEVSKQLLADASPHVRGWVVQILTEDPKQPPAAETLAQFASMALKDDSQIVRLNLASALQQIPLKDRWAILDGLTTHAEDATDHNLPLMYWYAAEPLADIDSSRALTWALSVGDKFPVMREYMIRRVGGRMSPAALAVLIKGLSEAKTPDIQMTYLLGINGALTGHKVMAPPAGWDAVYRQLASSSRLDVRTQAAALAMSLGKSDASQVLRQVVADAKADANARRDALMYLVRAKDAGLPRVLQGLLNDAEMRGAALRSLASFDDPQTPEAILAVFDSLPPGDARDALATLSARLPYAQALLAAVESKRMPVSRLSVEIVRQMRTFKDPKLDEQIVKLWGTVRDTPEDKARQIEEYRKLLSWDAGPAADPELGRAVFAKTCQQCHQLAGIGGKVGPVLAKESLKNTDFILSNVIDPSAVVAKDYQASIVTTNGRPIVGIVKEAAQGDAIEVLTQTGTEIIAKSDLDAPPKLSDKSMMPEDQLKTMSQHEIRSLVRYLSMDGQVPMLATADNAKGFFDGKDLAGWRTDQDVWTVENGEIVGKTKGLKRNNFLMSDLSVENFKLSLEIKLVGNKGNSGIQFRSSEQEHGEMKGYQADVGEGWWGKLYEENARALLWDKPGDSYVKLGDWNKYEIEAIGPHIRTWINGTLCVDFNDPQPVSRGIIAFQLHSGGATEVRFRNIDLQLIAPPTATAAAEGDKAPAKQ